MAARVSLPFLFGAGRIMRLRVGQALGDREWERKPSVFLHCAMAQSSPATPSYTAASIIAHWRSHAVTPAGPGCFYEMHNVARNENSYLCFNRERIP
jgi:hypothetical protein